MYEEIVSFREDRNVLQHAITKKRWKKMKPFDTKDEARGTGLKIMEDCKAGEFVTEYIGEIIDRAQFKKRLWEYYQGKDQG